MIVFLYRILCFVLAVVILECLVLSVVHVHMILMGLCSFRTGLDDIHRNIAAVIGDPLIVRKEVIEYEAVL